jgi:hypothetical protein
MTIRFRLAAMQNRQWRFAAVSTALLVLAAARTAHAAPCISIFTPEGEQLGFRNACDRCRVAVWAWGAGESYFSLDGRLHGVWQGGDRVTRKYRVAGRSEIRVEEEAPIGKLLREEACRKH